ncbi:hypothetical protein BDY19DRAFT_1058451 [Irpex rosettiformis]|uniref:Uncharacterized protein n=1 Tax=Irpex rosettiformis TaxID=378272 RepID=A0ACB8TY50_9APHY|nr:hypothetical protein BDY19DRAFT_1058451 [Irpex rosettiformis]
MLQATEAGLVSMSVEAILYGFSIFMYIITFWILRRNDHERYPKRGYMIVTILLLLCTTVGMITNIVRICQGFLNTNDLSGAVAYFNDPSKPTSVIRSCVFDAQSLLLDGVVIYRAWVVWGKDIRVVSLPLLAWCGLLASCIGINVALLTPSTKKLEGIFSPDIGQWITCMWSMTLITNVSATVLLAYKIWRTNRLATLWRANDQLSPALRVVIESGVIYSLSLVVALVTFAIHSPGHSIVLDLISAIISIVYNMIIIRVGLASDPLLRRRTNVKYEAHSAPSSDRSQRNGDESFHLGWPHSSPGNHKMKPLAIEIERFQETDSSTMKVEELGERTSRTAEHPVALI